MDRKYLLTYEKELYFYGDFAGVTKTYEWFEDEDEMNRFIEEEGKIKPIEKLYIADATDLK